MKTSVSYLILILIFCSTVSFGQVPKGLNYQAIARGSDGRELANVSLQVKMSILSDTTGFKLSGGGTYLWEEEHAVTTNSLGLFTIVIGGTTATRIQGSAAEFGDIDWKTSPLFTGTKIYYQGAWKNMGSARLWSVPFAMVSNSLAGPVDKLAVTGKTSLLDSALFEVKNNIGQTIFAVYNEGVRVYVDDGAKGVKGGFAIGGFGTAKAPSQEYFRVTRDSTRVYVNQVAKGVKGGFAIGGFNPAKGPISNFMEMTPNNYFIGEGSGLKNTTGTFNSFLGYQTGMSNTVGGNNSFIGYQSGFNNISGNNNLFLGYQSGYNNIDGHYNSFVGYRAGYLNTTGDQNSFLGSYSGTNNSTGSQNTFVGYYAGYSNTTGWYNNFFGTRSGYSNTTGYYNTFIGPLTGFSNQSGFYNVFIGYRAGYLNISGGSNVFIGYRTGYNNIASNNVFLGFESGFSNTSGTKNAFIGYMAGRSNTFGVSNVFVGNLSGYSTTSGNWNVLIGDSAGYYNSTGNSNVFIGNRCGEFNTTGVDNVFVGYRSGNKHQSNGNNVYIGSRAGEEDLTGTGNVFVGFHAGWKNTNGWGNTYLGDGAGGGITTGTENVCIGRVAGWTNQTGTRNVFIGRGAGYYETGSYRLYIDNSASDKNNALIYGEFDNKLLQFNGLTRLNGNLEFLPGIDRNLSLQDNTKTLFFGGKNTMGPWAMYFSTDNGAGATTPRLVISGTSGHIAVNQNSVNSTYQFYVNGPAGGTTAWNSTSDAKYKTNVENINDPLSKVMRLHGVTYSFKDTINFEAGRKIGFIAQEVAPVLPEVVNSTDEGYTIQYSPITALLVEAIKEQQNLIGKQSEIIRTQDEKINSLNERLDRLESLIQKAGVK